MKRDEFERVYEMLEGQERALLLTKRAEYAGEDDVLRNFKQTVQAMQMASLTPEDVCDVLLMKHVQAVMIAARDKSTRLDFGDAKREGFAQRVCDARNYLMLLAALVAERSPEISPEDLATILSWERPGAGARPLGVPQSEYSLAALQPPKRPCVHPASALVVVAAASSSDSGRLKAHLKCTACGESVAVESER